MRGLVGAGLRGPSTQLRPAPRLGGPSGALVPPCPPPRAPHGTAAPSLTASVGTHASCPKGHGADRRSPPDRLQCPPPPLWQPPALLGVVCVSVQGVGGGVGGSQLKSPAPAPHPPQRPGGRGPADPARGLQGGQGRGRGGAAAGLRRHRHQQPPGGLLRALPQGVCGGQRLLGLRGGPGLKRGPVS